MDGGVTDHGRTRAAPSGDPATNNLSFVAWIATEDLGEQTCRFRDIAAPAHDRRVLQRMLLRSAALLATSLAWRAPSVRVVQHARMPMATMRQRGEVRNPHNLDTKVCVVCNRPFTWRKKWEDCWDEVTCCSKRCNGERKKANRIARGAAAAEGDTEVDDGGMSDSSVEGAVDTAKADRKAAKKAAKAERRAKREGDFTGGQKECAMCSKSVDVLIRCQTDAAKEWKMVCGRCWKLPEVAGGVPDGDGSNPHYRYGGLWKNLARAV